MGAGGVQAEFERSGWSDLGAACARQGGGQAPVACDEDPQFVAAQGVGAGQVVDAGVGGGGELQEGGGEVVDVDGAAEVVGEQGARGGAGGQVADAVFVG